MKSRAKKKIANVVRICTFYRISKQILSYAMSQFRRSSCSGVLNTKHLLANCDLICYSLKPQKRGLAKDAFPVQPDYECLVIFPPPPPKAVDLP